MQDIEKRLAQAKQFNNNEETGIYQTFILVEVLSDRPCDRMGLKEIGREVEEGDFSGSYKVVASRQVSVELMAELLINQGSDPGFLGCGTDEENAQWA
jgi:hypothetical protein